VASSPRADPRSLGLERFRSLVDEAVAEGFREIYVTGGEPFLEPDIVAMLEYASERLDTVVLTNAMVFTGRRARELLRLAGRERLVIQTSLDGARPQTHDAWRGEGSWRRALDGIALARDLGLALRVAMTETPENGDEVQELRELLAGLDIGGTDFAVRPLVRRGFAEDEAAGAEVVDAMIAPELTVTADGVHWHPIGGDLASSPDLLVAPGQPPLAEAKRMIVERFLSLRLADGTLPAAFRCAV
jgi:MoaA/NifB/PqqE/SkfB family radical SAM enzyme